MRLPDITVRNALVTPLLLIRFPVIVLGRLLELAGRAIQDLGALVPAWTDYQRRGRQ
jgi:hypothetical protein